MTISTLNEDLLKLLSDNGELPAEGRAYDRIRTALDSIPAKDAEIEALKAKMAELERGGEGIANLFKLATSQLATARASEARMGEALHHFVRDTESKRIMEYALNSSTALSWLEAKVRQAVEGVLEKLLKSFGEMGIDLIPDDIQQLRSAAGLPTPVDTEEKG